MLFTEQILNVAFPLVLETFSKGNKVCYDVNYDSKTFQGMHGLCHMALNIVEYVVISWKRNGLCFRLHCR